MRVSLAVTVAVFGLAVAGCAPTTSTDPQVARFAQSRREAELSVQLATAEEKLRAEREQLDRERERYDSLEQEYRRLLNRHENERILYNLALQQNAEYKKQADAARQHAQAVKTLQADLLRLHAENEQLKKEIAALKGNDRSQRSGVGD